MLASLKKFFAQVFQDSSGNYSSKRTVTFVATLLVVVGFISNLFWNLTVEQFMFEGLMYIVIAGLGFSGVERITPPNKWSQASQDPSLLPPTEPEQH